MGTIAPNLNRLRVWQHVCGGPKARLAGAVAYDPDMPLGEFIRRQREMHELSMRQLAELSGISNPYLSQIERGLREPSEKVLRAIAENLELSAEAFYDAIGRPDEDEDGEEPAVVRAINDDPKLSARQRQALLEVYSAFTGRRRGGRGRRGR
jgi:transcriptional regulator with XRE-family HTH domain